MCGSFSWSCSVAVSSGGPLTHEHASTQVALANHDSRSLLCIGFADGVLHLYDTTRAQQQQEEVAAGGPGLQEQAENDADDADGEVDDEGEDGRATPSVKFTKAQRQLLLVPVAALKLGAGLLGGPSCLTFDHASDLLLAGTTGTSAY